MLSKKLLFSSLAGVAIVGILSLVIWKQVELPKVSEVGESTEQSTPRQNNSPLLIKVFRYTAVGEYGLDNIVEADSLEVRPRRFMAFNAKSINEAVMKNARLALFTYEVKEPYSDLFEFESALPFTERNRDSGRSKVLGRVTRLIADKIAIELFRDELKIIVLEAGAGIIDKKTQGAKFVNVVLQDVQSNRIVRTKNVVWDRKRNVFVIPGEFSSTSPSGSVTGKSVEIDMDFKITTF